MNRASTRLNHRPDPVPAWDDRSSEVSDSCTIHPVLAQLFKLVSNKVTEVTQMKGEYVFSKAEQGKFYVPVEEIQMPVYLDQDVWQFLIQHKAKNGERLDTLVNDLLRKDIEIAQRVAL